jgi:hypothetical protein
MDDAAKARARARSRWKGALLVLDHADDPDLSDLSISARIAELFRLSQAAFALSGTPWPTYSRSEIPGRCCLLADHD